MRAAEPAYEKSVWWRAVSGMIVVGVSQMVVSQTIDLIVIGTGAETGLVAQAVSASANRTAMLFAFISVEAVADGDFLTGAHGYAVKDVNRAHDAGIGRLDDSHATARNDLALRGRDDVDVTEARPGDRYRHEGQ